MSQNDPETLTQHAMLVVWGQFAQSIGLIDKTPVRFAAPENGDTQPAEKSSGIPGRHSGRAGASAGSQPLSASD